MNRAFFFLSPSFKELSQALHYPPLRPILLAPLLLSFMKSVASFLGRRNKGKGAAKEKHDASTNKQAVFVPKGASYIPTVRTFEASAPQQLSNHKARSQSEDPISSQVASAFVKTSNQLSDASSTCSVVDHEITFSYHPDISQPPLNPVVRKSSRSSSKSAMRGLSRLNLCSPISSTLPRSPTENSPVRPPRPPPLNLHCTTTKRPVNTGISSRFVGNRTVNLTSSPSPCAIKPVELAMKTSGSSSDSSPSLSGSEEEAVCSLCVAASPDGTYICPHQSVRRERHAATNSDPLLPTSPTLRTARTVLDLSDRPIPQGIYQSIPCTSSTPHLPSHIKQEVPPVPSLPFISSNGQADDVLDFPLSLFPAPPQSPLFVRRKIEKNLALRPGLASPVTPLLSSPSLTDVDYTPLVTPTTPRHQMNHSKSFSNLSRYSSSRAIPPPFFSPPSTPLPTPPTSPATQIIRPCKLSSSSFPKHPQSASSINELLSNKSLPSIYPSPIEPRSRSHTNLRRMTRV